VLLELSNLREDAEKLRGVTWANEPVATLEESVLEVGVVRAMLDAVECELVAAYDSSKEWKVTGDGSPAARIAHLSHSRKGTISKRCHLGRRLRTMPHTEAAFALGDITIDHVDVLSRANLPSLAVRFALDEERLVGYARDLGFDEFCAKVAIWRDVVAPEDAEERALSQHEARDMHWSKSFEGMGRIDGWMDNLGYHEVHTELDRHYQRLFEQDWADARARLGDAATKNDLARSPGQRRSDAMRAMARASRAHAGIGAEPTLGTTIVVDADTHLTCWARLVAEIRGEDPDAYPYREGRRCEFADGTRVTPEQALFASLEGWLNTLVLDEDGFPLHYGRKKRFFPQPLREALMIAFPVCGGTSCDIRSVHCEIDHILAWIDGGTTDTTNGNPLCKRDNLWKEHVEARRRRRRPFPRQTGP